MAYVLTYLDGTQETVPAALFKGAFIAKREKVRSYKKVKLEDAPKRKK